MCWFTLIPIKQTVGRLQRGGTACRVFYVDGAFHTIISNSEQTTLADSMLKAWEELLSGYQEDIFIQELYGAFLLGLREAIEKIDIQVEETED